MSLSVMTAPTPVFLPQAAPLPAVTETFRILLVEERERYYQLYQDSLTTALPVQVTVAVRGDEALQQATGISSSTAGHAGEPVNFDLIIMDLELPDMKGEDLLQRLRADHRLRHIPVMILTSLSSTDSQLTLLEQGADDFIEKQSPPEIIVARVKAQMRHKIALDRLTRMALDRDLFAAGVLKDIGGIRGAVKAVSAEARQILDRDPVGERPALLGCMAALKEQAAKLGVYASDVIQSVRESRRTPKLEELNVQEPLSWVIEVLGAGEAALTQAAALRFECQFLTPMHALLADRSFLRLVLLNILQQASRQATVDGLAATVVRLDIQQTLLTQDLQMQERSLVRTIIRDHGKSLAAERIDTLFQPYARTGDEHDDFGLGLSLVAKIMAMMGGRVGAEKPREGGGTMIWFDLPLWRRDEPRRV